MKKKKRMKKKIKLLITVIVLTIIIIFIGTKINKKYQEYLYQQTYEYKFLQKEYTLEEFKIINEKLDDEKKQELLEKDKIDILTNLLQEKYFLYKNLDRYITYYKKNKNLSFSNIISLVNVNRDNDYYTNTKPTDTDKGILMLVNKYNYLEETYEPEGIQKVSSSYAYEGNYLAEVSYEAFKDMVNKAKEEGIRLILNSSYRTYSDQEEIWTTRKNTRGIKQADSYAARAGYSEHQTGLALDMNEYLSKETDFENTDSFKWLDEHAHEYGFILRYPKSTDEKPYEDITGYSYESWHYRYVGKETATKIKQEKLTFEEYYAFYIEK